MSALIQEVVPFLSAEQRIEVRANALKIMLADDSFIAEMDREALAVVIRTATACLECPSLVSLTLTLFVNLSAESTEAFIEEYSVSAPLRNHCYRLANGSSDDFSHLLMMFLSNLSTSDTVSSLLLSSPAVDESFAELIIRKFTNYSTHIEPEDMDAHDIAWDEIDPWQYAGSVICNLSQLPEGRALLCKRSSNVITAMCAQVGSRNPLRRRGSVASLRNCLFDSDEHWWLVNDKNLLTFILSPLVVATPFTEEEKSGMDPKLWMMASAGDKSHEPDRDILKMLLESVLMLCQRRVLREELRKRKVYPIVRNLDYAIEDEELSAIIFEIVNFLMRDDIPLDEDERAQIELSDQLSGVSFK